MFSVASVSPTALARRATAAVAWLFGFLAHCAWVLLNGKSVLARLWSVAGEPFRYRVCVVWARERAFGR